MCIRRVLLEGLICADEGTGSTCIAISVHVYTLGLFVCFLILMLFIIIGNAILGHCTPKSLFGKNKLYKPVLWYPKNLSVLKNKLYKPVFWYSQKPVSLEQHALYTN